MDKENLKLDAKLKNKKELLRRIEEKEIEIENEKIKLQLANEEIEKIKIELKELRTDINNSFKYEVDSMVEEDEDLEISLEKANKKLKNEKNNNISIGMVEVDENVAIDEAINKIKEEVINYDLKENTGDIVSKELSLDIIDESDESEEALNLIERMKLSFIDNKNYDSMKILNEILISIESIECTLKDEEKILLLYLAYFYNKLEELLNKSSVVNEYYNSESIEAKLLLMLIEENKYDLFKEVEETVSMKIKNDTKLFKSLDPLLRVRIIDKINNISYKVFDGVYSIKDLKYGEENISLKSWVREKNQFQWRLVEGLYSKNTERLYMLESAISVLKLNINKF